MTESERIPIIGDQGGSFTFQSQTFRFETTMRQNDWRRKRRPNFKHFDSPVNLGESVGEISQ